MSYSLGVIPSKQDPRDYRVAAFVPVGDTFPTEYIVPYVPKIYDQGQYGMCVAFSCAAIKESQEYAERNIQKRYSPGFIYGNRKAGDYTGEGMEPREALKNLVTDGVPEYARFSTVGTYYECYSNIQIVKDQIYDYARPQVISSYVRIYTEQEAMTALTKLGPVLLTIAVYNSFYNPPSTGIIPSVGLNESITGYHALTIVGWKMINGKKYWIVNNSWGTGWGKSGQCYIPVGYKGINEMWSITDVHPTAERTIEMAIPMQVLGAGYSVLPFRPIYEAIGGTVTWGRTPTNKVWAQAVVPLPGKNVTIYSEEGSTKLTIK